MQHTHILKVSCLVLAALLGAALVVPVVVAGQEQELKTLKLVKTYQSEAEFQSANAKLLRAKHPIMEDGASIKFINPDTGEIRKQIQKPSVEPFTEEEKRILHKGESVRREGKAYKLVGGQEFLMQIDYIRSFSSIEEIEDAEYPNIENTKRTLYNAQGEVIATLPLESDFLHIELSPTHEHFIVYGLDDEGGQHGLYFYSSQGTLLRKVDIEGMGKVKYSQNGEFVVVFNMNDSFIRVFTKTGEVFFQRAYTDLIKDPWGTLYGVFVSEDSKLMLLETRQTIHLYAIHGNIVWERESPYLADCTFISSKNLIVAQANPISSQGITLYTLQILSLQTGEVLDEIHNVSDVNLMNQHVVFRKEGIYYE